MFKQISVNNDKTKQKKRNEFSVKNQGNQFDYGLREWQQDWVTSKMTEQNFKNVKIKNKISN